MYIIRKLFVYMSLIHCHFLRDMAYCVFNTCRYDKVIPLQTVKGNDMWYVLGKMFREM
ncbi:hypothetical protein WH47_10674 [Habropoda laboriosa]|uniref:Uncharacterized protein n=1 Tax=Habropoda laboriosa TaxID=597456 RepID=A0A0L7RC65_9HYME|nr:hypothetical protein WH47_10674 [Habropoda laboriosa]